VDTTKSGTALVFVSGGDSVSLSGLVAHLASLKANTAATPYLIVLDSTVTITTSDTSTSGVWATIHSTIRDAGKYVILDISACSATTIAGATNPSGNHFNIIKDNIYIKGITLPDTLTSMGNRAFYGCSGLSSVTIGEGVTTIGYGAFYGCTSLSSVTIPEGVTSMGDYAFSDCTNLSSVTIPEGVTTIGYGAFYGCTSLSSVTIPEGVTTIGYRTFYGCTSLSSVTIPEGVTSIGNYAFYGCTSLSSVTIGEGVTSIGDWAFDGCSGLTSVTIPGSVTTIGSGAFAGCSSLTKVTFGTGSNITTPWGNAAFSTSLSSSATDSGTDLWNTYGDGIYSIKSGTYIYISINGGNYRWWQES
jgi:hypothetical protein